MKFYPYGLVLLFPVIITAGGIAHAQSPQPQPSQMSIGQDPSGIYMEAWYLSRKDAVELAKKEDYMEAIAKAKKAESLLNVLSSSRPDWQSNVIKKMRQDNMSNIEQWTKAAKENAKLIQPVRPVEEGRSLNLPDTPQDKNKTNIPSFQELDAQRKSIIRQNKLPDSQEHANKQHERIDFAPIVDIQSPYEKLEAEVRMRDYENDSLIKALKESKTELIDALAEKNKAQATADAYKEKYEELTQQIDKERKTDNERIQRLTKEFNRIEKELKLEQAKNIEADKKIQNLQIRIEETTQMLAQVEKERDSAKAERDELAAIVKFNSPDETKKLLDSNLTLNARLNEAQAKIAQLETAKSNDADQIAINLKELERVRAEELQLRSKLAEFVAENTSYRKRISELNTRLQNTQAELDSLAEQPETDHLLLEENKLVKSIISKYRLMLATQQKGRELLIAEYKKLHADNPQIDEVLHLLESESQPEFTPVEKALVKTLNATEKSSSLAELDASLSETINEQREIEALSSTASKSFNMGRYAAAEQLYRSLLDKQPDNFVAQANLGTILIRRKLVDDAIIHLNRANELSPDKAFVHYMLGIAYYRKKADQSALDSFKEATRLEPDNAEAYVYMGNIESSAGNWAQAVDHYDKAIRIKPDSIDALFNKASTLVHLNKIVQARQAYDLAIRAGATPDYDLQRILDPNEKNMPLPVSSPQNQDINQDLISQAPLVASNNEETVESIPQKIISDAAQLPEPVITKTEPAVQPAVPSNPSTEPVKPAVQQKKQQEEIKQDLPKNDQKENAIPKNRRWSRFG